MALCKATWFWHNMKLPLLITSIHALCSSSGKMFLLRIGHIKIFLAHFDKSSELSHAVKYIIILLFLFWSSKLILFSRFLLFCISKTELYVCTTVLTNNPTSWGQQTLPQWQHVKRCQGKSSARDEVLAEMTVKSTSFWDVTLYSLAFIFRLNEQACCCLSFSWLTLGPSQWRRYIPPKCCWHALLIGLHDVTSLKIVLYNVLVTPACQM
jgi:hypothetical protein